MLEALKRGLKRRMRVICLFRHQLHGKVIQRMIRNEIRDRYIYRCLRCGGRWLTWEPKAGKVIFG